MENNNVIEYVTVVFEGIVYRFKTQQEATEFLKSQR